MICNSMMRDLLRASKLVARFGDEMFIVFCCIITLGSKIIIIGSYPIVIVS